MPEKTDAQKRAQKKYMENFVEVKVRMTPERREEIKAHSEALGVSVNAFISRAISEAMESDKARPAAFYDLTDSEKQQKGGAVNGND